MKVEVKCHQALVHVGAACHLGLQQVYLGTRCIGIVKSVNGRYAITVKQGKPRTSTYQLWLACCIILTCHYCCSPTATQEELS